MRPDDFSQNYSQDNSQEFFSGILNFISFFVISPITSEIPVPNDHWDKNHDFSTINISPVILNDYEDY